MPITNDKPESGFFLSFEGSEGCGKSTQIRLLHERLAAAGREVLLTREPGGTFIGERIRELLQYTPEAGDMCDESELLLFAASRAQLVRAELIPALEIGAVWERLLDKEEIVRRQLGDECGCFVDRPATVGVHTEVGAGLFPGYPDRHLVGRQVTTAQFELEDRKARCRPHPVPMAWCGLIG